MDSTKFALTPDIEKSFASNIEDIPDNKLVDIKQKPIVSRGIEECRAWPQ
jgi:hypothetical protein